MSVRMVLRFSETISKLWAFSVWIHIKPTQPNIALLISSFTSILSQEFSFSIITPRGQILNSQNTATLFTGFELVSISFLWSYSNLRFHSCSYIYIYIRRSLSLIQITACCAGLLFQSIEHPGRTSYPIFFLPGQSFKVNITIQWGHFWTLE